MFGRPENEESIRILIGNYDGVVLGIKPPRTMCIDWEVADCVSVRAQIRLVR